MPLRVLPTTPLRVLRLKILKILHLPSSRQANLALYVMMQDGQFVQISHDYHDKDRDLLWYGINDGSDLFVYVPTIDS